MQKSKLFALLFLSFSLLHSEEDSPPPIGNFSVPTVTQISPLVSFGQLIIGKNALLPELTGSYTKGNQNYSNTLTPNVMYGILDTLSITLYVPFTLNSKQGSSYAKGINDITVQGEYAYYAGSTRDHTLQATIVGNVTFPSGSSSKDPPTGIGAFGYLVGTTCSYMSSDWYAFVSPGAYLTTTHNGEKFGNAYLYQWGFARYIKPLSPKGWIFNLLFEFDGTYTEKTKIDGIKDPDSGGNLLLLTPSIWLSSDRVILQWGMGFPILQRLNGEQEKTWYSIGYNIAIAFQF